MAIATSDVLNRGTTFLIYIIVARKLGTVAFGQMSLALTFFYSFQVIAVFGMQTLITRDVAKSHESASRHLANGALVALLTGFAAMALMGGTAWAFGYSPDTTSLIVIASLGLIPFAISAVCESILRGWEQMHLIALTQVPVNVGKVAATALLLWSGGDVFQVITVLVVSQVAICLAQLGMVIWKMGHWPSKLWDVDFARNILRRTRTFVGIDLAIAWLASVNIILLSKLLGETEAGFYNAASQLMIPLLIFFQSVMVSAFPIMCRRFETDSAGLQRVANRLMQLLLTLAIPGTVGLIMIAEPALEFVFGDDDFVAAAGVLRVIAFIMILRAITFALGHVLLAGHRERTTLRIVVVNLLVAIALGWILIVNFGLMGAAFAAFATRLVDLLQHLRPARNIVARIEFGRILWRPLTASLVMAGYLFLIRDQHVMISVSSGAVVYFVVYFSLEPSWIIGMPKQVQRIFSKATSSRTRANTSE